MRVVFVQYIPLIEVYILLPTIFYNQPRDCAVRAFAVYSRHFVMFCIFIAAKRGLSTGINLSIVAMALAGINTTNNTLWLSKCKELHSKINNPYLRATFAFLTCGDNFKQILVSLFTVFVK